VIIADNAFEKPTDIETITEKNSKKYVKNYIASMTIPYNHQNSETFGMRLYFGPNHYPNPQKYDLELQSQN